MSFERWLGPGGAVHSSPRQRIARTPAVRPPDLPEHRSLERPSPASDEWVGGEGLADASQARSTHVREGIVTVTDGPFLEAKEALAGYCIVDVANRERAEEIAARWPDAQHWGMEFRALMHGGGEEG